MMSRTRVLVLAALLVGVAGCAGDEPGKHRIVPKESAGSEAADMQFTPEGEGDADPVERGRTIYSAKGVCFACHGPAAKGTQIAPDLTDNEWLHFEDTVTPEELVVLITDGVQDPIEYPGVMPPMGGASLTGEEVEAVAAYVYSLSH